MNERLLELIEELEKTVGTFRSQIFDPKQEGCTVYESALDAQSALDNFIEWYEET